MDFYQILERGNFKYHVSQKSVLLQIPHPMPLGDCYISFSTYASSNRLKHFRKFQKALVNSKETQFSSVNDIYGLANRYHLKPTAGRKPEIVGTIAF